MYILCFVVFGLLCSFGEDKNDLSYTIQGPNSIWICRLTSIGNPIVDILRSSNLHNGNSYTDKTASLYRITHRVQCRRNHSLYHRSYDESFRRAMSQTYSRINKPSVLVYAYDTNKQTLQWRHNGRDNVSNHQPHDCLLNRLFRRRSKKTSKLRVTGLCAAGTGEFPAQMASYAENVSIWWRHHE